MTKLLDRRFLTGLLAGGLAAAPARAFADMFQNAANADKPEAQINLGIVPSATSYGALGDGAADDTAALQAMFDAASAADRPWYIPPGAYRITAPVTLYTGGRCDGRITLANNGQTWKAVTVLYKPADLTSIPVATVNAWTGIVKGNNTSPNWAPYYGKTVTLYSPDETMINRLNAPGQFAMYDVFIVDDPSGAISPPINQTKLLPWTTGTFSALAHRGPIVIEGLAVEFTSGSAESSGGMRVDRPQVTLINPSVINHTATPVQSGITIENTSQVTIISGYVEGLEGINTNYGYAISTSAFVTLIDCREIYCRRGVDLHFSKQVQVMGGYYPDGIGAHWGNGLRVEGGAYVGSDLNNSAPIWYSGADISVLNCRIVLGRDNNVVLGMRGDVLSLEGEVRLENNQIDIPVSPGFVGTKTLVHLGASSTAGTWDWGRKLQLPGKISIVGNTIRQIDASWVGNLYLIDMHTNANIANPQGIRAGGDIDIRRNTFNLDVGVMNGTEPRLITSISRLAGWDAGFGPEGRGYVITARDLPCYFGLGYCNNAVAVPANQRSTYDVEAQGAIHWRGGWGSFQRAWFKSASMVVPLNTDRPGGVNLAAPIGDENELWESIDGTGTLLAVSAAALTINQNHNRRVLQCSNAGGLALTVPANATVPLAIGYVVEMIQAAAGQVVVAGAGGVTVTGWPGLKSAGLNARIRLEKTALNAWNLSGALVA